MKITIICSDAAHPVNRYLENWLSGLEPSVDAELVRNVEDAKGGDLLFLVSCSEIVRATARSKYRACLVLHASDLPKGRGWSPHIWDLAGGASGITLSLLEVADPVDSGRIWRKKYIPIPDHALWTEINDLLFEAEIELINFAVMNFQNVEPVVQPVDQGVSYHRKRSPLDSQISPYKSIAEQFNLIRVCDSNRYPAFFDHLGHRYRLTVEKCNDE